LIPAIPAEVQLPLGFHPIRPLLDSGADCTMLPRYIGQLIGLDFAHLPKRNITGIEGRSIHGFKAFVRLRVAKLLLPSIPCIYVDSDHAPLLLGREGFFDLFNITLDNRRKKIVLTQVF
jgi:Aspartyl protease